MTRAFSALLLVWLVGVATLADASPPDPLWLSGVYDGADADDAIALLDNTALASDAVARSGELRLLLRLAPLSAAAHRDDCPLLGSRLRSPPTVV